MKREDVWSLPIWEDKIDDISDYVIKDIIYEIERLHQSDCGRSYSNKGGWQSNDFVMGDNAFIDILLESIQAKIDIVAEGVGTQLDVTNCWVNINNSGDHNSTHIHTNCSLSGVVYLEAEPDQGNIVFSHPFSDGLKYAIYNTGLVGLKRVILNDVSVVPSFKKIIMFPPFYPHKVEANKTDRRRISVAFNAVKSLY